MKTLKEQLACAKRELALRKNVYPKWVAQTRIKQSEADHELACMADIVATLQKLQYLEDVSEEMRRDYGAQAADPREITNGRGIVSPHP